MNSAPKQYQDEERLDLPSASALGIAVRCPGQPNLKRVLPIEAFRAKEDKPDEWAERGTRIHKAGETGNTDELDAEELETYKTAIEFEQVIVDNWMRDRGLAESKEGPRELRLFLNNPNTLEPIGSAKLDRHYLGGKHLLVIDWKSGWNPNLPTSARSWQLRFQAVAAWQEYADRQIESVRVAHCKPKSDYGALDVCDYFQSDLENSMQSILFHLWETTQDDAPRHAGHWCNWCPCKPYCAEAGAYSLLPTVIAKQVKDSALMPWPLMVESLAPVDLLRIWESSTVIGKIIDAVKERLKKMPAAELAAIGLELGVGRRMDNVGDIPAGFEFLIKQFPEKDVLNCMSFGKGALIEMIRNNMQLSKEGASRWLDANLNPWLVRETSEPPLRKLKG